jgi:hypothetical protein
MTPQAHDICRDLYKQLESVQHLRHLGMREIFDDFCTISMAAWHNYLYTLGGNPVPECYRTNHDKMEDDYAKTIKKYDKVAHDTFSKTMATLAAALLENPMDYLGKIYMDANMGNKSNSQFFTPPHICEMMAQMTIASREDFEQKVATRGYVGVEDPCCGSGAMSVALAKVLGKNYGVPNLDTKLFLKLTDVDYTCVKMAFVQMSLLGLSACVIWGDTLSGRIDGQFDTPQLQVALLTGRLRMAGDQDTAPAPPESEPSPPRQLVLF